MDNRQTDGRRLFPLELKVSSSASLPTIILSPQYKTATSAGGSFRKEVCYQHPSIFWDQAEWTDLAAIELDQGTFADVITARIARPSWVDRLSSLEQSCQTRALRGSFFEPHRTARHSLSSQTAKWLFLNRKHTANRKNRSKPLWPASVTVNS